MTQEDRNLLLRDLCARVPYGVIYHMNDGENIELREVDIKIGTLNYTDNIVVRECKPYLRPMSSMTEEEQEEFLDLIIPIDSGKAVVEEDNIERYNEFIYAHHFDNKGLIEKGLAVEAPENMYKNN